MTTGCYFEDLHDRPDRQPRQDHHRGRHPAVCRGLAPTPTRCTSTPRRQSSRCSASASRTACCRAGLISAVLGTRLPGPGTLYMRQSLRFRRPGEDRRHGDGDRRGHRANRGKEARHAQHHLHRRRQGGDRGRGLRPGPVARRDAHLPRLARTCRPMRAAPRWRSAISTACIAAMPQVIRAAHAARPRRHAGGADLRAAPARASSARTTRRSA